MPTPWSEEKGRRKYPKLYGNEKADVLIIGGGLAGVWTAYLLAPTRKVLLIEADVLGSGATVDTTAFITEIIDTDADSLVKMFGEESAKAVYRSHRGAMEMIVRATREEKIDCELRKETAYVYAAEMDQYPLVEREYETLDKLGVQPLMHTTHDLEFLNYGHYEVRDQYTYHPIKFLNALAAAAERRGALIYEQTEATNISGKTPPYAVEGPDFSVTADWVIVATYNPFNKPDEVFAKKGMYKSYALEAEVPKERLSPGIYWDKHNPYNYFRVDPGLVHDRLILGGQDHRYELPVDREERFLLLEEYLKRILPETGYTVTRKWAGPILEPSDGLPLIGKYRENQLLAAGFSGNGMTYSPIAGMIFRDIVESKANPWTSLYDPERTLKPSRLLTKGKDYAEEFFNGVIKNFFR